MMASPHVLPLVHHPGSLGRAGFRFLDHFLLCRTGLGLGLSTGPTGGDRGPSTGRTGIGRSTRIHGSGRLELGGSWAGASGNEPGHRAVSCGRRPGCSAETLQQYGTRENRKPEENNKTAENQGPRPGPKDPFFNALAAVKPVGQADRSATARPSAAAAFPGSPAPGQSSGQSKTNKSLGGLVLAATSECVTVLTYTTGVKFGRQSKIGLVEKSRGE